MIKSSLLFLTAAVVALVSWLAYLAIKPTPLTPIAWDAPANPGYTGQFQANDRLQLAAKLATHSRIGPESIAADSQGRIYTGVASGEILRANDHTSKFEVWATTGGRPLGLIFDAKDNLLVADAFLGLLRINQQAQLTVLSDNAAGIPIRYADDLAVAKNGDIYFTDASTKYSAAQYGGTLQSSILDLVEHGGHGRLLKYSAAKKETIELLTDLQFANGVALSEDESYLLVVETGMYRVLKYWITGENAGNHETILANLPGFPDNITTGKSGQYWIALPSTRSPLIDKFSAYPLLRRIMMSLPKSLHPKPIHYTHIIAIDGNGNILSNLQNTAGVMPVNSSVLETNCCLLLGSLTTNYVGIVDKERIQ